MKKIVIVFAAVILTLAASAQRGYRGGYHGGYRGGGVYHNPVYYPTIRPRVYVSTGIYANPFYYPGYFFSPYWGYVPYSSYGYGRPGYYSSRPSRLGMQIEDIKADYKDKIWSARHDKSLKHAERRRTIHQLKADRDREIREAEMNYYKRRD